MPLYFHHFAAPLPSNTSLPLPIFALSLLPSSLPVFLPCLLCSEARGGQPPPEGRSPCTLEASLPRLQAPHSVASLPTHFQRRPPECLPWLCPPPSLSHVHADLPSAVGHYRLKQFMPQTWPHP